MITADQILCHMIGDYLLQSDWMAQRKTRERLAAVMHCWTYCIPFAVMLYFQGRPLNMKAVAAICAIYSAHYFIDRFRLARYVCWLKNFLAPRWIRTEGVREKNVTTNGHRCVHIVPRYQQNHDWEDCKATGYYLGNPVWLSTWLMIITDNTLHVLINGIVLYYIK